jgi:uncharacterized membrane protein
MITLNYKVLGAIIGALVVFFLFEIGFEETIVVLIFAVIGYFVGSFISGEFDIEDVQRRIQRRR